MAVYRFRCNTATRTTRLRDRSASPVCPHRCRRPTGTSAGNRIPSAADNRRFQATCQLRGTARRQVIGHATVGCWGGSCARARGTGDGPDAFDGTNVFRGPNVYRATAAQNTTVGKPFVVHSHTHVHTNTRTRAH